MVVDANVWSLRDWVLMLEQEGASYKTFWTEDILAEVLYHLRREHPTWDGGKILDARRKIIATVEGGHVEDFTVDGSCPWKDPDDQHVHAAALACCAGYVLTNDKGFMDPSVEPDELPYEVYRPDDFFVLVDDSAPQVVRAVIARQVRYWSERGRDLDLCSSLRSSGCPEFARRVLRHLQDMALETGALPARAVEGRA